MDLSILQKVNEMISEGRSTDEIRQILLKEGVSPENISEALRETSTSDTAGSAPTQPVPLSQHREKIIQPSPGFDPTKIN
jgi:SOS response regulatory protein OraA/RecX